MLRQIILGRKIEALRSQMAELTPTIDGLQERRAAMAKREADITAALGEVTEETSVEDKAAIEAEADKWAEEDKALTDEEQQAETRKSELQSQIDQLTAELDELNKRGTQPPAPTHNDHENREDVTPMIRRTFYGMSTEKRDAFFSDEKVKKFLGDVRSAIQDKRAIANIGLNIPLVMLTLIEQVVAETSQLLPVVRVEQLTGTARQRIMGDIPEAVWTEQCAKLNELGLSFSMTEFDGYKVGGFIAVCNAMLEDNDVDLAAKIIDAIGKAIAKAVDKSIIFGTGVKMPVGIFTRLAQTTGPSDPDPAERAWTDLHTKNIKTIASSNTGVKLFQELLQISATTSNKYASGAKFWAMNDATFAKLQAELLTINAAGSLVTGQSMTMPVIGGSIVILDFMPADMIVGGYGQSYTMVQRRGMQFAVSDEYRFVEDQTVFKGTARYDGKPVIPESFVAIGIGTAPSASGITFAPDTANTNAG